MTLVCSYTSTKDVRVFLLFFCGLLWIRGEMATLAKA